MKYYSYDEKGFLIGEFTSDIDPLETDRQGKPVYLLPRNATWSTPPKSIDGKIPQWNDQWTLVDSSPESSKSPEVQEVVRETLEIVPGDNPLVVLVLKATKWNVLGIEDKREELRGMSRQIEGSIRQYLLSSYSDSAQDTFERQLEEARLFFSGVSEDNLYLLQEATRIDLEVDPLATVASLAEKIRQKSFIFYQVGIHNSRVLEVLEKRISLLSEEELTAKYMGLKEMFIWGNGVSVPSDYLKLSSAG